MFCAVRLYIKQHAGMCENFTGGLIVFRSAESANHAWRGNIWRADLAVNLPREKSTVFAASEIMRAYSSQQNEYRREVHPMFHGA
jgi:hypothetical protein